MIRPDPDPVDLPGQKPENDTMFQAHEEAAIAISAVFYLAAIFVGAWLFLAK